MNRESFILPEELYHTYIIEGDPNNDPLVIQDILRARQIENDILCQIYDSFTVADSTFLKGWHSEGNTSKGKRICIIGAKAINREAENALLKMFEEPKENTHFFVVVPNQALLAETILSRAHVLRMGEGTSRSDASARAFISATKEKRLGIVDELIKSHKDDDTSGGLRYDALQLISDIERVIHEERFLKNKNDIHTIKLLEEISTLRRYLGITGASVKMILEHLSLVI